MARTRPSGLPIISPAEALVMQELAEIDGRGRIDLLPRWAERVRWLPVPATSELDALMILTEPGRLSLTSWEPHGPRIIAQYESLARLGPDADPDDLEGLRAIQDRYRRLLIPKERRPTLGDAALQHLGLPIQRGIKSSVYVAVFPTSIDLLSPTYRNSKNLEGHSAIDELP